MPREINKRQDLLVKPIRVAVLGSGGREHALAQKIWESPLCSELVVLPGNDGIAATGIQTRQVNLKDHAAMIEALRNFEADLVVVGPDDLLAAGVVDVLEKEGFAVFGPTKASARLEWSKAFAKEMMEKAGINTARFSLLTKSDPAALDAIVEDLGGYPVVLKYDGLALGKGVRICPDRYDALEFVKEVFEDEKFSKATRTSKSKSNPGIVVEQFLSGHEVSVFAVAQGETFVLLEPACDHKRLLEGNNGPNTGGMGAYSPVPWLSTNDLSEMSEKIFKPLLSAMNKAGAPFKGLLYAGLMVNGSDFWVLEFNARFGDPETQVILPRLDSDLLPILYGVAIGSLSRHLDACPVRWTTKSCVNVVLASRGYPESPETGHVISGLPEISKEVRGSAGRVYFAGVTEKDGAFCNTGGRVLSVSALGESVDTARRSAISVASNIHFEGAYFRKDVGSVRSS